MTCAKQSTAILGDEHHVFEKVQKRVEQIGDDQADEDGSYDVLDRVEYAGVAVLVQKKINANQCESEDEKRVEGNGCVLLIEADVVGESDEMMMLLWGSFFHIRIYLSEQK